MKKIILTGGGTAGHVNPNIALLPQFRQNGWQAVYIGGKNGIEKKLLEGCDIDYYEISAGKLRRYMDLKNVTDAFRVIKGLGDALAVIRKVKPDAVFSKGGFVTVPVVAAAWLAGVPVVIHESDITPGLANKISMPFAAAVCTAFPETAEISKKAVHTGAIIRREILTGDRAGAAKLFGLNGGKPTLLVTGGSSGAARINECVRKALPELLKTYNIIHLCGRGGVVESSLPGYRQFEYLSQDMPQAFALADVIVSRAGANTIFELLALGKPHVLIPLGKAASRGDQIMNARSFEAQGFSNVLPEEEMTPESLADAVNATYLGREKYIARMREHRSTDGIMEVCRVIEACADKKQKKTHRR